MTITLEKNRPVNLEKKNGSPLVRIALGLGWDGVKKGGFLGFGGGSASIDLDASALVYAGRQKVDEIWFRQLKNRDGTIRHSGDNRTGDGDGDDETISVDLARLPSEVTSVVFTVNSFTGQTFEQVANAQCRVVDLESGEEIARYSLTDSGRHTGMIMAIVSRTGSGWTVKAIGERASGRTFHDMANQIDALLV